MILLLKVYLLKQYFKTAWFFGLVIAIIGCQESDYYSSEQALTAYKKLAEKRQGVNLYNDPEAYFRINYDMSLLIPKIEGHHDLVLDFYHNSGYIYRRRNLHSESLNMYKSYFQYYDSHISEFNDTLQLDHLRKRSFNYRGMAIAYEHLGHLDSAYFEHEKNLNFVNSTNTIWEPAAHNDFGIFLIGSKNDTINALQQFQIAYDITKQDFPNHELLSSICDNLGQIYLDRNEYLKALEYFNEGFHLNKIIVKHPSQYGAFTVGVAQKDLLESGLNSLKIFNALNESQNASKRLAELQSLYRSKYYDFKRTGDNHILFLNIENQAFDLERNYKAQAQNLERIQYLKDSLESVKEASLSSNRLLLSELNLSGLKTQYALERQQKEARLLNQRLTIWIIVLTSMGLLSIMGFLVYRRKQMIIKTQNKQLITQQQLELTAIKNKQLKFEIQSKQRDLADFALNLTQNQEWAKVLLQRLQQLKQTKGRARSKELKSLELEIHNKVSFDTNTEAFYERLEKLSHSFYEKLKASFPDLSKNELRLCSLIRLNIDSRHIANLSNITLASLNTSRYRLRKKMKLDANTDLDGFIQSL